MFELLIPTTMFAISMTGTPGPNNMLLTVSGARFGYRRTVPLILGIVAGIQTQLLLVAVGLGIVFATIPVLQLLLRIVGVAYLLYLAVRIAFFSVSRAGTETNASRPLRSVEGALFQYVNPKAWVMTVTAMSVYTIDGDIYGRTAFVVMLVFLFITPISVSMWAAFGTVIGRRLSSGRHQRTFNIALGLITAASAAFVLL